MSRSGQPKLSDVAAIFRLAREACELGDDPISWRKHVLNEFSRLFGLTWGGSVVMPINFDSAHIHYFFTVFVFGDSSAQARWQQFLAAGNIQADPNDAQLMRMLERPFTRIRPQLCDDRTWYSSSYFNEFRRPMDQDDLLYSHLPLPQYGCASGFGFTRSLKDPPFHTVHRRLLHLFHQELGRMWTTPPLSNDSTANVALSPRMRQTLDLLSGGKSEKQVAVQLGISRHTVHDHVKELHRRMDAGSLGELLAKSRPPWRFRPHLGLDAHPPVSVTA